MSDPVDWDQRLHARGYRVTPQRTLVLAALDYPQARNYDGSWIEWANNSELPVVGVQVATSH